MKSSISALCMTAAIILAATGCGKHQGEKAGQPGEMPVSVAYPTVDSLTIHKVYPGLISADNTIDVVARVDGFITAQHFTDGQKVRKGDVLYSIESSQYADAVAQAQAQLESAQSETDYATRQYQAMKKALESDAVSQMDVIQAENAMRSAQAAVKTAKAALQTAQTNLGYCTVRALSDGHIAASNVDVGAYVSGAGEPMVLTTIYDDATVYAAFSVNDSRYIELLSEKPRMLDSIGVTFDVELPHKYVGSLEYVAPDIDESTGTLSMRVTIPNPYGELKSGMYAKVALPVSVDPKAILVNDAAISTDQRGKYLYTVNDSNRVVYTPIEVGDLYQDTLRVVTSGITPKTKYVTKALLKVRDGMTVKPILH